MPFRQGALEVLKRRHSIDAASKGEATVIGHGGAAGRLASRARLPIEVRERNGGRGS